MKIIFNNNQQQQPKKILLAPCPICGAYDTPEFIASGKCLECARQKKRLKIEEEKQKETNTNKIKKKGEKIHEKKEENI